MAVFVFDGTADVSVANFDPALDTLIVDGINIDDVGAFTRTATSFVIALDNGTSVSLSGANLDALTNSNFSTAGTSDIDFAIGDGNPDNLTGNLGSGGFGDDVMQFSSDGAILYGNQQNDSISGVVAYENMSLYGGAGDDTIDSFGAGTVVYGGLGSDYLSAASGLTEGVTIYGGNGSSDSMDGNDTIEGDNGNDLVYGNAGDDSIEGYDGDDMLFGGMGNDTIYDDNGVTAGDDSIYGNTGDDYLETGSGSDLLFGGQGDDTLFADNYGLGAADDAILLSGGLGADSIEAYNSVSENITIYGGNGASDTTDGNDSIYGSLQGDLIYGNAGNDSIYGYDGDDTIFGGLGDDTIDGDYGINAVTGGAGADTFTAFFITGENYSVITDFTKGEDLLDVSTVPTSVTKVTGTGATEYDTLAQVVTDFGTILAGTAEAVTVTNGDLAGITFVLADTDADGAADQVIAMTGFTGTITATDFV